MGSIIGRHLFADAIAVGTSIPKSRKRHTVTIVLVLYTRQCVVRIRHCVYSLVLKQQFIYLQSEPNMRIPLCQLCGRQLSNEPVEVQKR